MKKPSLSRLLVWVATLLGFVTMFLPFASAVKDSHGLTYSSAYSIMFGQSETISDGSNSLGGSLGGTNAPFAIVAWFLMLLGLVVLAAYVVLDLLGKNFSFNPWILLGGSALLILAGILFFCVKKNVVMAAMGGSADSVKSFGLAFGFVGTGIFAILSGLSGVASYLCPRFLKK